MEPFPSSPSKFSFEYLLLPPRSAPTAAPPGLVPYVLQNDRYALLLIEAWLLPRQPGIGRACWGQNRALQRHPFSGLVDSADGSNGEPTGRHPEHADAVAHHEVRAADHD
ncbi:unnamed protein product [Brassica napus]|uniref:(rape) hypothetical protein n=1 Tax=Brassica napus TaxID=3708 RepID=A0A816TM07_BRANA|nr:unnamed protein product [Brassica napus]